MSQAKKPGRKPNNPTEGSAKNYTIRLTDAQAARALKFGDLVSQGVNNLLRQATEVTQKPDSL